MNNRKLFFFFVLLFMLMALSGILFALCGNIDQLLNGSTTSAVNIESTSSKLQYPSACSTV